MLLASIYFKNFKKLKNSKKKLHLLTALCGVFGSFCLNRGLQLEKAAPAALMRNVDILLAFLFDYAFFGQQPHLLTLLGGVLVILSTGGVALGKWWRSRDTL